LNNKRKNEKKE